VGDTDISGEHATSIVRVERIGSNLKLKVFGVNVIGLCRPFARNVAIRYTVGDRE
jgi:hypothetical protein